MASRLAVSRTIAGTIRGALSRAARFLPALCVLLAGCNPQPMLQELIPEPDIAFGRQQVESLRQRDFDALDKALHPALAEPQYRVEFERMADWFPRTAPLEVRLVRALTTRRDAITQISLWFEYEYSGKWVLAEVALEPVDGLLRVRGIHVSPQTASRAAANAFGLQGKRPGQYALLAAAVLVPVLILFAFILILRTALRWKWLWMAFVLVGLVPVQMDWTTGSLLVSPLSLQLLGSGFARLGSYAPMLITTSVPLGALLFLGLRRRLARNHADGA